MYRTRHPGQSLEIVSSSHSVTGISWHGDSISAFHSSAYPNMGRQSPSSSGGVPLHPIATVSSLASSSRASVVPHAPRSRGYDSDAVSPDLPQEPMGLSGRSGSGFLVLSVSSGSPVVESGDPETGEGESLSSDTGPQLFLRRLGHRLGSPGGRTSRLRYLVSQPGQSLDQHERADCGAERSPGPWTPSRQSVGGSVLRQHHYGRLSPSFRRNIFLGSQL